jgi:hypothetical protein
MHQSNDYVNLHGLVIDYTPQPCPFLIIGINKIYKSYGLEKRKTTSTKNAKNAKREPTMGLEPMAYSLKGNHSAD